MISDVKIVSNHKSGAVFQASHNQSHHRYIGIGIFYSVVANIFPLYILQNSHDVRFKNIYGISQALFEWDIRFKRAANYLFAAIRNIFIFVNTGNGKAVFSKDKEFAHFFSKFNSPAHASLAICRDINIAIDSIRHNSRLRKGTEANKDTTQEIKLVKIYYGGTIAVSHVSREGYSATVALSGVHFDVSADSISWFHVFGDFCQGDLPLYPVLSKLKPKHFCYADTSNFKSHPSMNYQIGRTDEIDIDFSDDAKTWFHLFGNTCRDNLLVYYDSSNEDYPTQDAFSAAVNSK